VTRRAYSWTTTDDSRLVELWADTMRPAKAIAIELRCCEQTLQRHRKRLGLPDRFPASLVDRVRMRCTIEGDPAQDCWIWRGYVDPSGQPKINTDKKPKNARRVAAEALGRYDPRRHRSCVAACGEPLCVSPYHAQALTPAEHVRRQVAMGALNNAAHMAAINQARRRRAKLSHERVAEARERVLERGEDRGEVARSYGVTRDALNRALAGRTWRDSGGVSVFNWTPGP